MALISIPNIFTVGAVIVASQHNSNFSIIYSDYNGNIDNTNLSASASIVDTKLSQITTASKVSGAAITLLTSVPSGAGILPVANIDTGTTANKIVQLTAASKLPAVDGSLLTGITSSGVTAILGTWDYSTYSADTIYQASSDGMVFIIATIQGNAVKSASILTDASNPPTHSPVNASSTSSTTAISLPLTCFVKKTHFWKASNVAGSSVSQIYWIPLGV